MYAYFDKITGQCRQLVGGARAGGNDYDEVLLDVPFAGEPGRLWREGGVVKVYGELAISATPNPVAANSVVTVTATLPPDSPDTEARFQVYGGDFYSSPVVSGQADHTYVFSAPGTYRIAVLSAHHGTAAVEVTVQ